MDIQPGYPFASAVKNDPLFRDVFRPFLQALGFEWGGDFNDPPHFFFDPYDNLGERQLAADAAEEFFKNCIRPLAF